VNDLSIQAAQLSGNKQINIRGNIYQALILADYSSIQLKTAEKIKMLALRGMNLIATGNLPRVQPSFLNWKANDRQTAEAIRSALKCVSSKHIKSDVELNKWINTLHPAVKFNGHYQFTREVERDMSDGSRIQFIWNKSNQWQILSLTLDKTYEAVIG
jgi:hypothetical protein